MGGGFEGDEGIKAPRVEPEETEDVDTLASSAFCVDIPRGILRANELESAPVRNEFSWIGALTCTKY